MIEANSFPLQRRALLQAAGALVVSSLAPVSVLAQAAGSAGKPGLIPEELDSWVAILPDGAINAYYGKVDLGQSLEVAIAQIVAEELDVRVERVHVLMGDSATSVNQGGASNASGIQQGAKPLRNAAAEARRLLVDMAAASLGVPSDRLAVNDGVISVVGEPTRQVRYTDLVGGRFFNTKVEWNKEFGNGLNVQGKAKPKAPSEYKVVGQPVARRDVARKVFGRETFTNDVKVPGMLHARVIRSPIAGATPVKVDAASIAKIRGVRIVQEKNFLAVVSEREWDVVRAARELKVQWSDPGQPFPGTDGVHAYLRSAPVAKREDEVKKGDAPAAFAGAARVVEAEYEWPFQSHASMGPSAAVVDAKADSAQIWTGSQKPHYARDGVAAMLGLKPEQVHATWVVGAGSYGRNDAGDAVLDAALLSKLTKRPVRVQYMRHDATALDPKAPASVHRARAALDASGQVVGYQFVSRGFSRVDISTNEADLSHSLVGMEMGLQHKPDLGFGSPAEAYGFANKLASWEVVAPLMDRSSPLRTSHMRDPVGLQVHFASEQFMDEVAAAAGQDPVAFRLRYLQGRDAEVVRTAAQKAGWQPRSGPRDRSGDVLTGRGIAYATRNGTLVSVVAEIEVDKRSGRIWARKMTVAHDCGLVINPLGLRQTIEAALVQGISRTLQEEVRFDRNRVTSVDWMSYPILDIKDAPESVDIVLVNRPELPPTGAGEATPRIVPAAIANAFFDATGVRLRRAPLTPERVKAALARA
jgi:nicotinate dehydrogenase subunit B